MHDACAKNVLEILEIEVHTWKLNVLVDCSLIECDCSVHRPDVTRLNLKPPRVLMRNSQLAQHSQKTGHSFDFESVSILHICPQWNRRLFLEAWYSDKKRTRSTSRLSFHMCTSISCKNFQNIFSTRVMHICHLLARLFYHLQSYLHT